MEEVKTVLTIICGWCGKPMGEKDGKGQTGISHGICPECYDKVTEEHEVSDNMRSYWRNLNSGSQR